jgi:hypothetical protein
MPSAVIDHTIVAGNTNGSGPADCDGPIMSDGYNLIGATAGCTITGSTTGNLLNTDPQLVGPFLRGGGAGMNGGLPAWVPRSSSGPSVDAGNPAGATYDNDADPATAEVPLTKDQWNEDRPIDGDDDGTARTDIGAIEFQGLFFETFESGDTCYWSSTTGGPACP